MPQHIFRINRPTVSAESFDDEVIIIHFENGNYYSLDSFGTSVWKALEAGADQESILHHITKQFRAKRKEVALRLDKLLEQLLAEDLVLKITDKSSPWEPEIESEPLDLPEDAGALLKFDDMQELLLLDPIHDVDEAGWPHTRQESSQKLND